MNVSKKTITQPEYDRIIRETCERPFGPDVVSVGPSNPSERDYLYGSEAKSRT